MTQMDLASAANSSMRHLSYLETGRSQPSREMIMRLAEELEIPLRERNTLHLSAGFAPLFQERSLDELASARHAIDQILQAHRPFPAFAIDRKWNIVLSNKAIPQLYVDVTPELLQPPVNAVRLMLHPLGLAPRILNFMEWRDHIITLLRHQIDASGVQALLTEILTYPFPTGAATTATTDGPQRYATPLQIATEAGTLSFLNTTTIFGTPTDVTLSELALELLFPADSGTREVVMKLAAEQSLVRDGSALVSG
jgi:transcriptional regulator with XRE-family HTH domain